jgi:hypothetical protein
VGDAVVVLSEAKQAYDMVRATKEAGKEKTKNFFRRIWEFVWPPARPSASRYCATTEAAPATELVVPAEEIPALPRSVDEALEDFEACKAEGAAERMAEAEAAAAGKGAGKGKAKTRGFFQAAKDRISGKAPARTEEDVATSYTARCEQEIAEAQARAKGRHW